MDLTHWILLGVVMAVLGMLIWCFVSVTRLLRKDEAIDAATVLALRELRERFARSK